MSDLSEWRRFFAEEIRTQANLQTPVLIEALATVPRESFLRPGPWLIRSEASAGSDLQKTPDDDPRHVYHNVAVAIDPARQLFNGAPSVLAAWIDALGVAGSDRVLHVGCGTGYYSAILAHCAGPDGRVVAIDVDTGLVEEARRNLAGMPQVEVRHGDGTDIVPEAFDAILVNAGVTHPHDAWLEALRPGGRLLVPLTCTFPQMGPIGKGIVLLISRPAVGGRSDDFPARQVGSVVVIYSAVGIRDARMNERLGRALARGPVARVNHLRRDPHDAASSCWLHGERVCISSL